MKILLVIEAMEMGGAEMDILRNFPIINQDKDFEVVVCLFRAQGSLYNRLKRSNIRILSLHHERKQFKSNPFSKLKYYFKEIKFIHQSIAKESPDVVHCFLPQAYLLTCIAKIFRPQKDKTVPHASYVMSRLSLNYYMKKHPVAAFFEKKICHARVGFCKFIGNSRLIAEQLIEEGCDEEKVKVLYNGINLDEYPNSKVKKDFKKTPIELVSVGNLHTYKGYNDLINALAILKRSGNDIPPWHIKIAGEDRDGNLEKLRHKAALAGISDQVIFLGGVDNVTELLSKAHILVHPSHTEGLPNAVIEAMASGLPVIATNVGGIPELVRDDENGYLIDAKNPYMLADVIKKALLNRTHLYQMGQNGCAFIAKRCNLDVSVQKYKEIYRPLSPAHLS